MEGSEGGGISAFRINAPAIPMPAVKTALAAAMKPAETIDPPNARPASNGPAHAANAITAMVPMMRPASPAGRRRITSVDLGTTSCQFSHSIIRPSATITAARSSRPMISTIVWPPETTASTCSSLNGSVKARTEISDNSTSQSNTAGALNDDSVVSCVMCDPRRIDHDTDVHRVIRPDHCDIAAPRYVYPIAMLDKMPAQCLEVRVSRVVVSRKVNPEMIEEVADELEAGNIPRIPPA